VGSIDRLNSATRGKPRARIRRGPAASESVARSAARPSAGRL
jgi:hypothetical protein